MRGLTEMHIGVTQPASFSRHADLPDRVGVFQERSRWRAGAVCGGAVVAAVFGDLSLAVVVARVWWAWGTPLSRGRRHEGAGLHGAPARQPSQAAKWARWNERPALSNSRLCSCSSGTAS